MLRLILGTAGHIDHGKTALVRALTGVDTDRLPEEKRRGITIDLGFAELRLDAQRALSVVDVPGHESFIRNMVAGASGMDMVLLVVAADEGVMPQTREHLAIVELLGISRGVVALTKCDLVDADWLDLVREDVRELLTATALRDARVVAVSARSGAGMEELRSALSSCADEAGEAESADLFRMPIDRVFTVRGTGTVVTGTVWSGSVRRDAQVRLLPTDAGGRVRTLQQHGVECDEAVAGTRAAIALTGIDRHALERGAAVVAGPGWAPGSILTVDLEVIRAARAPVTPRQRVRVHVGTAEVLARVGMAATPIDPGSRAFVQLRLEEPVLARAGDRLVVRSYSPVDTIAGGVVLEPLAPKRRRLEREVAEQLRCLRSALDDTEEGAAVEATSAVIGLAGADGAPRDELPITTGFSPAAVDAALAELRQRGDAAMVGARVVAGARLEASRNALISAIREHHARQPAADGMPRDAARRALPRQDEWLFDTALEGLVLSGTVTVVGNALAAAGFEVRLSGDGAAALDALRQCFAAAGLEPPEVADLPPQLRGRPDLPSLLRMLERDGTLLRLSADRWISADAVLECARALKTHFAAGQAVGMSDLKNSMRLTRKHLIPLLEHFDRSGVTRREGDVRVIL